MPTNSELVALFHAISMKDWASVENAAKAIVTREDEKGHYGAAQTLRGALAANGGIATRRETNGAHAAQLGPVSGLLRMDSRIKLADVQLRTQVRRELERFILEWRHRDQLQAKGLETRHRLLFYGPPGCGKSMTANALGVELGLPVFVVRFDSIITSYLGQTAINLRQLFHFIEHQPCVLLVDELDALGRRRGDRMDVGELDRIVISLMQELEHGHPAGLIIATCNLPDELDRALWRRFDAALEFPLPTKNELASFISKTAPILGLRSTTTLKEKIPSKTSYADAMKLLEAEARNTVLRGL